MAVYKFGTYELQKSLGVVEAKICVELTLFLSLLG
jgi:hypothetical protein